MDQPRWPIVAQADDRSLEVISEQEWHGNVDLWRYGEFELVVDADGELWRTRSLEARREEAPFERLPSPMDHRALLDALAGDVLFDPDERPGSVSRRSEGWTRDLRDYVESLGRRVQRVDAEALPSLFDRAVSDTHRIRGWARAPGREVWSLHPRCFRRVSATTARTAFISRLLAEGRWYGHEQGGPRPIERESSYRARVATDAARLPFERASWLITRGEPRRAIDFDARVDHPLLLFRHLDSDVDVLIAGSGRDGPFYVALGAAT